MKTYICVLLLAALVAAEPPRYRKFRVARAEEESGSEKESSNLESGAPYAAAGFKPNKEFKLPSERQELAPPSASYGTPDDSYRAPLNTYIAPQTEYGVPRGRSFEGNGAEEKEGENSESAESPEENSEEIDSGEKGEKKEKPEKKEGDEKKEKSEKKRKGEKKENLEEGSESDDVLNSRGVYYVLLPDSQLQRVQFQTTNDLSNMAYTARLQYKNEDRAPVYVYSAVPQYQPTAAYSAYGVYQW